MLHYLHYSVAQGQSDLCPFRWPCWIVAWVVMMTVLASSWMSADLKDWRSSSCHCRSLLQFGYSSQPDCSLGKIDPFSPRCSFHRTSGGCHLYSTSVDSSSHTVHSLTVSAYCRCSASRCCCRWRLLRTRYSNQNFKQRNYFGYQHVAVKTSFGNHRSH